MYLFSNFMHTKRLYHFDLVQAKPMSLFLNFMHTNVFLSFRFRVRQNYLSPFEIHSHQTFYHFDLLLSKPMPPVLTREQIKSTPTILTLVYAKPIFTILIRVKINTLPYHDILNNIWNKIDISGNKPKQNNP